MKVISVNIERVLLLLLLCQLFVLAKASPVETTVTCKFNNYSGSAVFLYRVENGEAVSLGFKRPDKMDTCVFSFPMEKEGLYFIRKAGAHMPAFQYVIYLKPGDKKSVDLFQSNTGLDFDSCKIRNPNKETIFLQQWTSIFNGVCKLGVNRSMRSDFIVAFNKLVDRAGQLKRNIPGNDPNFKYLAKSKIDTDIEYARAAAFFHFGERMNAGFDSVAGNQKFYQSLVKQNFCDANILQSENGLQLLKYNLGFQLFQQLGEQQQMLAVPFADKMKMICNDTVRLAYALSRMQQITNYELFKNDIQPFKKLFASTSSQRAYQKKEDELTVYAKGAQAYNFSLTDTKDQVVSLSDFKGKVVVMDVWAMWCAPCLAEKPFFVKTEEEFKNRNDIVFIGISHDGLSRKSVWKNFVEKKGWKNIELLANYNESIGKYYKIEDIPRFMIFDKEGKIISVDAPRPSNPAFKKLIEQTLKTEERATH